MKYYVPFFVRTSWLCSIFIGLGVAPADGQFGLSFAVLNPKTYRAPAGQFVLTIDPGNRDGSGEATYRLDENGKERWSATLPFTLWDAGVTDGGVVVGYGYTQGPSGGRDVGEFVVAIIDPDGKIQLKESVKREHTHYIHGPPTPMASGLIVDESNDRMVVRVDDSDLNRREESWWVYRLSTATAIEKLNPKALMKNRQAARLVLDARAVPGTVLTLVHWWLYDDQNDRSGVGARFTLVDLKAKPIWTLELPGDYSVPGNEKAEDELRDRIDKLGGILRSDQPGQIDLLFAAESKRVTFSAKQDNTGQWKVTEVARAPYTFAAVPVDQPPSIPVRPLKYEGPLVLQVAPRGPESPLRKVYQFAFDGQGRIAFLREDGDSKPPVFVLADQTGKLLHEIPVTVKVPLESRWKSCWVGGSRFIVANAGFGIEAKSQAWQIDTKTGTLQAIAGFDCPAIDRLVGFADGGFVALSTMRYKYTSQEFVIGFNALGQRVWTLCDDFNDKGPNSLFGVKDIARTTKDEIVVLENILQKIKCFNRQGRKQREIDIKQAWGRDPSYPTGITTDADGGFIVNDFQGSPPFVRMKRDGTVRAGMTPKYTDGRAVSSSDGIRAAPDGRLWACDGDSVMRLSDEGVVDLVLGRAPQTDELGKIAGITVDRQGQIYAVDSRTGSAHVFDATGKLHHICKTRPTDFGSIITDPAITVNDQGYVYLGLGSDVPSPDEERRFAHWTADGTRLDDAELPAGKCYFQAGTGNIVALRYEEVLVTDRSGESLRTIRHCTDGNWLQEPLVVSLAADGSLAILSANSESHTVNLYDASGGHVRIIGLPQSVGPFPRIAYDGRWAVVAGDSGLVLIDAQAATLETCTPPQMTNPDKTYWCPYFARQGRELLLFDGHTATLHRYTMP